MKYPRARQQTKSNIAVSRATDSQGNIKFYLVTVTPTPSRYRTQSGLGRVVLRLVGNDRGARRRCKRRQVTVEDHSLQIKDQAALTRLGAIATRSLQSEALACKENSPC